MNKKIKLSMFLLAILILFIEIGNIQAKKEVEYRGRKYYCADENQAIYCGYQDDFYSGSNWKALVSVLEKITVTIGGSNYDFDGCITVNKPGKKHKNDSVSFSTNYSIDKFTEDTITDLYVYSTVDDIVYKDKNNDYWWSTLRYCASNSTDTFSHSLHTNYYDSTMSQSNKLISYSNCMILTNKSTDEDLLVETCPVIADKYYEINKSVSDYKSSKSNKYLTKYKKKVEEIRSLCTQTMKYADYSDGCMSICLDVESKIYELNQSLGISEKKSCGFSQRLINWILNILKWIKYIIPVVVIVLGSLDFIKATASEKDDEMKKAQANFVKRLISAALIFLIPLILEFILPKFGFDYNSCGLF